MHSFRRVIIELLATFITVTIIAFPGAAADFPNKPITFIIPYGSGGAADITARAIANITGKYLDQPVMCDNKPGESGTLGPAWVIAQPPDGYTLGLSHGGVTIAWNLGRLKFNPLEDTTPIIRYSSFIFGLVVRADAPWKTIHEFVAYAKENPGKIIYGTPGVGTNPHLAIEELSILAGIQLTHKPPKGGEIGIDRLLAGEIDAISDSSSWSPLVEAGKLRLLATYGTQRIPRFPGVPTLKEAGYEMVYESPLEIIGPKRMAQPIVDKLHEAFKRAMDDSDFVAVLKKLDMSPNHLGPKELKEVLAKESEKYKRIIQRLGLDKK